MCVHEAGNIAEIHDRERQRATKSARKTRDREREIERDLIGAQEWKRK